MNPASKELATHQSEAERLKRQETELRSQIMDSPRETGWGATRFIGAAEQGILAAGQHNSKARLGL
jgi:hypothetical protein